MLPQLAIDCHVAGEQHLLPVGEQRAARHGRVAEEHARELSARVLEREVNVPRRLRAEVGDFARDRDLPDLLVVDGGKGQLNAALAVLADLGLNGEGGGPRLHMVGIVKPRTERRRGDREATDRVVLPGVKDPVRLPHNSGALRVLQAIRDEVHDTAVRYHRFVRDKRSLTSALERLSKTELCRHFADTAFS